ncbi:hypothetical protein [Sinisalibacter aestuarii]|uniref:Uncharacterized protein n=1 Tax=Sinisalibacter aestuarii TaxID=2949426 RepID=A0ABQ5LUK6_9RHOB|nr:hypothetical protein [Sinisalibacter aestuarii]GKY87956.1 hypothetical protein STA1M1_18250 [Sinisalibacter aestuarii]
MPVSFRILPARDLTVATYSGFVTIDDSMQAAAAYAAHPDFRPDQKFLFDSTRVTGHEKDFARFLQMQGQMAGLFAQTGRDQLIGCVAPNDTAREMALLVQRGWQNVDRLVMMIHEDEAEVLAFLGQPERSIADLLAPTGSQR